MSPDAASLEAELRQLQATTLDDAFFARLEAASADTLTTLSHEEIRFEALLRQATPAPLPADFLMKLEAITSSTPFGFEDKILPFPKAGQAPVTSRKPTSLWRAAAAVAIIGASTALLIPAGNRSKDPAPSQASISRPSSDHFIPASFDRNVSNFKNEGTIWNADKQPQSVIRVEYKDKIIYKDSMNRTFQIEQPRVQYMSVPVRTD